MTKETEDCEIYQREEKKKKDRKKIEQVTYVSDLMKANRY